MYLFTYSPTFFKPAPIERPASPGPSPPSKSLVLRLFLCFLLPSILSTNAIQDGDWLGSLGWIKYFVVLSVLLVLESVLDHVSMLQTRPWVSTSYKLFKLVLIVWCLAPTQYNGSHLTYTHILAPIFHLSKNVVLYLTDVTLGVIDTVLAGTVAGFQILGECVQTAAEYSMDGLSFIACTIKCKFNIATQYFLTGAEIVINSVIYYTDQAIQHSKYIAQIFIEYIIIILEKICQYSLETYNLLKHILETLAREISITFVKFGEILAGLVCNTVCGLKYSVRKLGEGSKTLLMVSLELLSRTRSTGEEYRLMAGLLRGDKGDQPRRLISDWFREQSVPIV